MNWLKNLKFFAALLFVCGMLLSVTVTSCENSKATEEDSTEQSTTEEAENNEHPKEEGEHPKAEHPKSDSDTTKVEESQQ